jgi:protein-S-isoprenylcysteine O-methyltransferase Ste14
MRLPDLGERGQGWVVLQVVLIFLIALAGVPEPAVTGPAGTFLLILGGAFIVAGGVMVFLGSRTLGRSFTPDPRPLERGELVQTGIYASIRHPIYGGLAMGAFGWGCYTASPIAMALSVLLLVVVWLKSIREEAWLVDRYPEYAEYRSRTRRFFPRFI